MKNLKKKTRKVNNEWTNVIKNSIKKTENDENRNEEANEAMNTILVKAKCNKIKACKIVRFKKNQSKGPSPILITLTDKIERNKILKATRNLREERDSVNESNKDKGYFYGIRDGRVKRMRFKTTLKTSQ